MRFGVCCKLDEIDAVAAAGYDYLELRLLDISALSAEEFEALSAKLGALGPKAEVFNCFFPSDIMLVGPKADEAILADYAERALARAGALGGKIAVLGNGKLRRTPEGEDAAACRAQFKRAIQICGDAAARHGMKIAIEPLNYKETDLIQTVAEGLEICKEADHPAVGCLVDFYHVFMSGESPEAVETAEGALLHAHIARPNIDRGAPRPEDAETLLRWSAALKKGGYDQRLSLEISGKANSMEERLALMNDAKKYFI